MRKRSEDKEEEKAEQSMRGTRVNFHRPEEPVRQSIYIN